jgi:hypothetical protein
VADVLQLFDEWAASYARDSDPLVYLERAGVQADELSRLMDAFLRYAARGEASEQTLFLARAWASGASPLVELRASRGIPRDEVVDAVMREFQLAPKRREKVKRYYHDLEWGLLDPTGLDTRLTTSSRERSARLAMRSSRGARARSRLKELFFGPPGPWRCWAERRSSTRNPGTKSTLSFFLPADRGQCGPVRSSYRLKSTQLAAPLQRAVRRR